MAIKPKIKEFVLTRNGPKIIWRNLYFQVKGQNALGQSDCRIL